MSEDSKLNAFLGDEPMPEAPAGEDAPAPDPEQPEGDDRPRDEKGRFAAKETGVDPDGESAAPPATELPKEEYKAIREEREKRQNLERELEALKQQFQQLQQPKEPAASPPSIWEDEKGAFQHFGAQVVTEATLNARVDMSEMLAAQAHDDFDEMRGRFLQMMEANPALQQQALEAKHPWEKAYQIAKNAARAEELGAVDLADLEAKMREKIMAELQQGSTPVPQPVAVPPSLTGERNVGSRSGPAWAGPSSLAEKLAF